MAFLDDAQLKSFQSDGYIILESFFDNDECEAARADIDRLEQDRKSGGARPMVMDYSVLGALIAHPRVMAAVHDVMGPDFAFHHLHAVRQDAGTPGVHWHQDYEQFPQTNRSHTMVHLFYYFNGLNGEIGDLLVVPGTQHAIVANDGLRPMGTADLPGTVVVDNLPPGSAVLVHSAVWHARRAKPGGELRPRYFADASYCQNGVQWPSYGGTRWKELLQRARSLGLDANGKHAHLFDERHFFDETVARALVEHAQGSLILDLKDWKEQ